MSVFTSQHETDSDPLHVQTSSEESPSAPSQVFDFDTAHRTAWDAEFAALLASRQHLAGALSAQPTRLSASGPQRASVDSEASTSHLSHSERSATGTVSCTVF